MKVMNDYMTNSSSSTILIAGWVLPYWISKPWAPWSERNVHEPDWVGVYAPEDNHPIVLACCDDPLVSCLGIKQFAHATVEEYVFSLFYHLHDVLSTTPPETLAPFADILQKPVCLILFESGNWGGVHSVVELESPENPIKSEFRKIVLKMAEQLFHTCQVDDLTSSFPKWLEKMSDGDRLTLCYTTKEEERVVLRIDKTSRGYRLVYVDDEDMAEFVEKVVTLREEDLIAIPCLLKGERVEEVSQEIKSIVGEADPEFGVIYTVGKTPSPNP